MKLLNRRFLALPLALFLSLPLVVPAQQLGQANPQSSPRKAPSAGNPEHRQTGIPSSWQRVAIPPLHKFTPQQPRRFELPNGMVVFLQEDHELPFISGTMRIRGGSRDDPAYKAGLTAMYSEVWRTGGTKSKTGDQLDDFLESHAARVETSAGADSTFLSWNSLKENFEQVFPVVLDLLENPEFREDKIDLARKQFMSEISRRNDEISDIAHRESIKLAYGPDNPYARTAEYYTVSAITRQDLLDLHKRTVAPNNIILGVSGDFDPATMERKLRDTLGALPKGEPFTKTQITFHEAKPGIYFVEKEDVNQSAISMVDLGTDRRNPDYYAIEVMNELFGGGFSSRLVNNVRTIQGLAYAVGGGVGTAFDHPGVVHISVGTKSGSTAKAIEAVNEQIAKLIQGGVTEEELKKAKDSILNSFIFAFDSKEKVLAERMAYEFYGYPADFLERYRAGIEKVTAADVDRVAKKYMHPDHMAILVVGNSKDFDRQLATFGKVTSIDISIPEKKPGM
jgi:zinc protease